MTNISPNTNTQSCNHPSNKIVLTPEGEYVCSICGVVLTLDEAVERRVYTSGEAVGYLDPHGKTNPWLLGLGSVIPNSYLAKVAKRRKLGSEDDSNFANIVAELVLERYGQELMDTFHTYTKDRSDYAIAAYIAVMNIAEKYELHLDAKKVMEVVNRHFECSIKYIPPIAVSMIARTARRLGARRAYRVVRSTWR